jgi:hypothetical protein
MNRGRKNTSHKVIFYAIGFEGQKPSIESFFGTRNTRHYPEYNNA